MPQVWKCFAKEAQLTHVVVRVICFAGKLHQIAITALEKVLALLLSDMSAFSAASTLLI